MPLRAQVGASHRSMIKVAELMEEHIEKPLSLDRIARTTGLSRRQIERLFRRYLGCVPKRYYLEMRLRRARELLLQTAMPIMDVTTSCGFKSPPLLALLPQPVRPPAERRAAEPPGGKRFHAPGFPPGVKSRDAVHRAAGRRSCCAN